MVLCFDTPASTGCPSVAVNRRAHACNPWPLFHCCPFASWPETEAHRYPRTLQDDVAQATRRLLAVSPLHGRIEYHVALHRGLAYRLVKTPPRSLALSGRLGFTGFIALSPCLLCTKLPRLPAGRMFSRSKPCQYLSVPMFMPLTPSSSARPRVLVLAPCLLPKGKGEPKSPLRLCEKQRKKTKKLMPTDFLKFAKQNGRL